MLDIIANLNKEQKESVLDTEGYVLVFAGAGSGKTKVLTTRIAHLINDLGVSPYNILAITFTNKAADEMKERLGAIVGDCANEIWVSTIHGMCVRILRNSISRLEGYNSNFTIYSEQDKNNVLKRIIKAFNLDGEDKYLKNARNCISNAKNNNLSPAEFKQNSKMRESEVYAQIYYNYQEELRKSNALDFDDLLIKTYEVLSSDKEVLSHYAERFKYIHIDEFQDTNKLQFDIAKLLSSCHDNLFAVGDDDQSIYGWRGADINNILDFKNYFKGAKIHKLEQNYRSTKKILDLANTIIAGNSIRQQKKLWTENGEGDNVEVKIAENENEEAYYCAFQIKRLMEKGVQPKDCAILMRINALSRPYEQEFTKYGIPFKVYGGFKFFERKEIKDIIAYLRILTNPLDNESVLRIINVPKRGIGDKTLQALVDYANKYDLSVFDGIIDCDKLDLSSSVKNRLSTFKGVLVDLMFKTQNLSVSDIFKTVVNQTDFMSQFEEDSEENYARKMNISEFQSSIEEFEKLNANTTLSDYLNSITLSSDTDEIEQGNYVSIATIHSVKGLEFDNVFICGLDDTIFPISRATNSEEEMEEERRLMYVAITRAKSKLFLSRAKSRFLFGDRKYVDESCFFEEVSNKLGIKKPVVKRSLYTEVVDDERFSPSSTSGYSSNAVKNIIKKVDNTQNKDCSAYKTGVKVIHAKFGEGVIISTRGSGKEMLADVAFKNVGIKCLAVQYAPIQIK